MPKPDGDGTVATEAGAPVKTDAGPKPRNIQDHKAHTAEARDEALERAFGDFPDDDDLLSDPLVAGSTEEEEVEAERGSKSPKQSEEDPRIAALQARLEELEEQLQDEKGRQGAAPDEEPEFDVEVPEGWDGIKPVLAGLGKRADAQSKELAKQVEALTRAQYETQAKVDLAQFAARHADFWKLADAVAETAKKEGIDLYDYKSLSVAYDLVKGRIAMRKLQEVENGKATAAEMAKKGGAVPRFRSTQQQVRDEDIAPGGKLLKFDEAWEKSLAKLRKAQRR